MKNKNAILLSIAIAALVTAAVISFMTAGGGGPPEGLGQPVHFVCNMDGCDAEFTLTVGEVLTLRDENNDYVPCAECGKMATSLASKCYSCGRFVRGQDHDITPANCPYCGVKLGQDIEHTHGDSGDHTHPGGAAEHGHDEAADGP